MLMNKAQALLNLIQTPLSSVAHFDALFAATCCLTDPGISALVSPFSSEVFGIA